MGGKIMINIMNILSKTGTAKTGDVAKGLKLIAKGDIIK